MPDARRSARSARAADAPAGWERSLRSLLDDLPGRGGDPAILEFEEGRLRPLSRADLSRRIARLSAALAERGVAPGDRVAILGRGGGAWVAACLAAIDAGAVATPVDATLDREALAHVLGDCAPKLILADPAARERVEAALEEPPERLDLQDFAGPGADADAPDRPDRPELDPHDPALLFYTSGTTGPPKGVPLTHANIAFEIDRLLELDLVERGERLLLPLPLHHVYPFVVGLLTGLAYGVGIVFPRSLTGPDMQTAMREGEAAAILGVPRLYETLLTGIDRRAEEGGLFARKAYRALTGASLFCHRRLRLPVGRLLLRSARRRVAPKLRLLVSGGAPLDEGLAWRLDSFGWTVAAGYGLTETSPMLTVLRPGDRRFDSVGRAVRGVALRIAPQEDEDDAQEGAGEIQARGPNVFGGYLHLPDKTAEAFSDDGWYRTEDRGRLDEGGHLQVLGRSSLFVVTDAGENISLEELEASYAAHPLVREIGVFMRDGRLRAVAVPDHAALRERGEDEPERAVRSAVEAHAREMPDYKRVVEVAVAGDALDRTLLGKIRRDRLEARFDARREGGGLEDAGPMPVAEMPPEDRDLLEHPDVREVWDLLARRFEGVPLRPDTDVAADLGIDSLQWVDVTLDIRDRTGVELGEAALARVETVRDLLEEVREASGASDEAAADLREDPERLLSDDQRRWLSPLSDRELRLARGLHALNRALMRVLFRLQARGLDNLPQDAQVYILPNHASYLDGFAVAAALPFEVMRRTVVAGAADIAFATPLHRRVMRLSRALPIEGRGAAFADMALPLAALRRGDNLLWFPEGRRSADGELQPVRPGIALLIEEHPAPVLPVFIEGAHAAMPRGAALPRPRRITVHLGRPVPAGDLAPEAEGEPRRRALARAVGRRLADLKASVEG